jgi:hypothetical protein
MKKLIAALAVLGATVVLSSCTVNTQFTAGAERPTFDEWAAYSCETVDRVSQVTSPKYEGNAAYRIEVRDGDDSFGERCELSQGNTSASNIRRVGGEKVLFHFNETYWIQFFYMMPNDYPFCGTECSLDHDGGLILQLKQLGSCGTPALGLVATRDRMMIRNSDGNFCENATMHSLQGFPTELGKWVGVRLHVKFHTDPNVGFIEMYKLDTSGMGRGWEQVGGRVNTHTMKSPTDHPAGSCDEPTPCSHSRIGIYRDPKVTGTGVIYHDGFGVARVDP